MTQGKIQPAVLSSLDRAGARHEIDARAPLRARITARVRASRLDRDVERCAPVRPGGALAIHVARLVSIDERERLAAGLQSVRDAARGSAPTASARVRIDRAKVLTDEAVIDDIMVRLRAPRPVRARGVARLRMLLSDGAGPLYTTGHGSLAAELRGVLAAL